MLHANFIGKETPSQILCIIFCEIFLTRFFAEQTWETIQATWAIVPWASCL